ncbi:hypothetical protein M413DRAFT_268922 [Hebeloma cylindrosporum]|uniref:Uncharacterized protein n=1 Tax=Hebeloma cylindrosporum TaxID=76867 RepID=A0A0C2Z1K5_HEBCY|nr:hypothetical protein M413DRAFT_268922 [Hebeloma cylindrosporum h7]
MKSSHDELKSSHGKLKSSHDELKSSHDELNSFIATNDAKRKVCWEKMESNLKDMKGEHDALAITVKGSGE